METSIILQHLHAAHLDQERRNQEMLNEQLRIARLTRPSTLDRLRAITGDALIALGQRLSEAPEGTRTSPRPA